METAIDWLLKEQFDLMMNYQNLTKKQYMCKKIKIQNQAKDLEKENIEQAYLNGLIDSENKEPKNYYNKTYNQNK